MASAASAASGNEKEENNIHMSELNNTNQTLQFMSSVTHDQNVNNENENITDWEHVITLSQKRKRQFDSQSNNLGDGPSNKFSSKFSPRDPRLQSRPSVSFISQNTFEVLSNENENTNSNETTQLQSKVVRPPPIHLQSDVEYLKLQNFLCKLSGPDSFFCKSTSSGIIIYPSTPAAYRTIVKSFRDNNAQFYTYQLGEDKTFRVVLRGLHHSVGEENLKNELVSRGFPVLKVTNVLSRDKVQLPLFFIDMIQGKDSEKIYKLDSILMTKIQVEPPRQKRQISQCLRCQRYGHTKGYCNLIPRCVKCAGLHDSKTCEKPRDTPAVCVLCNGCHPASYRGCTVHRELQHRRSPAAAKKIQGNQEPPVDLSARNFPQLQPHTASSRQNQHQSSILNNQSQPNPHRLSSISYSRAVSPPNIEQSSILSDNHSQLTVFMNEMRQLISPLINMMTQLLQVLLSTHAK